MISGDIPMRISRSLVSIGLGFAATIWAGAAFANMEDMVACRNIGDSAARLACYDGAVDGVRAEIAAQDEAQRAELAEERDQRSFFGLPSFGLGNVLTRRETNEDEFGQTAMEMDDARESGRVDELAEENEVINNITANVVEWGRNPYGKIFVVLENGHVWRLEETQRLALRRNRDNVVEIRRGRMGNFFIKANGVPAEYRVERVR